MEKVGDHGNIALNVPLSLGMEKHAFTYSFKSALTVASQENLMQNDHSWYFWLFSQSSLSLEIVSFSRAVTHLISQYLQSQYHGWHLANGD